MPLFALHLVDYSILALYLAGVLGVGFYFNHSQKTTKDYFLAGRSMHWLPVGMSLVVTLFSALSFTGIPAESFRSGLVMLPMMFNLWLAAPIVMLFVMPFFYNLEIFTAYEYLEKRFDLTVRFAASLLFVMWRMIWLASVLYAPCKVLLFVLGFSENEHWQILYGLMIGLGLLTTAYTFLGGMKAVIWTDAMQFCVVLGGMAMIFGCALVGPAGIGLERAWQIASGERLTQIVKLDFTMQDRWVIWAYLPHYLLATLSFYTADQITLQRYLTTNSLTTSRRSMLASACGQSLFTFLLVTLGVTLHVFYAANPQRQAELIARAPPRPTASAAPPASAEPTLAERIDTDRVLPHFIVSELPIGFAGVIVAALFAAAMSSFDSGINSLSTSLIVDFHRRLGLGREWLAERRNKPVEKLDEEDELSLARPLSLGMGVAATGLSLVVAQIQDIFQIMVKVVNTLGGPLLAVFLLGMFVRRVGPRGALAALVLGTAATCWMTFTKGLPWVDIWNLPIGMAVSAAAGIIVSLLADGPVNLERLDGLVAGVGQKGLPRDKTRS